MLNKISLIANVVVNFFDLMLYRVYYRSLDRMLRRFPLRAYSMEMHLMVYRLENKTITVEQMEKVLNEMGP